MPEALYAIGSVIPHKDAAWRVIRIIHKSETLCEYEDGRAEPFIAVEAYVQLKSPAGEIDFVILQQEKRKYDGGASIIRGCEPVLWSGAPR